MTSHRILRLNALSTAACGLAMLAAPEFLRGLFGLTSSALVVALAVGLLAYAALLALAARRQPVSRQALIAFSVVDGLWVAASVIVLLVFWGQLAPFARVLVIAVALVVEVFATLQLRAASRTPAILQAA